MARLKSAAALQEPQEADSQEDEVMNKDDDVNTSKSQAPLQAIYCAASQHPVLLSADGGCAKLTVKPHGVSA